MKKIGMLGFVNNLSTRDSSHNGGWTMITKSWLENLKGEVHLLKRTDDISSFDVLVLNEGVNFREGQFNFFGGVQEKQKEALINFSKFKGEVYSINQLVDYNILTEKRKEFKELNLNFPVPKKVIYTKNYSDKLVLGDSHSMSVYRPGFAINRIDGKTLHGFLKIGLSSFLDDKVKELVFYAGNIDVRFHIGRQTTPSIATENLCMELEKQLKDLNLSKISIVGLLPTENESRKIPKTGQYKGLNFVNSANERRFYVRHFNRLFKEMCDRNNWEFLNWDFDYESDLSFDNMEARQSVHLRPSSYMYFNQLLNS